MQHREESPECQFKNIEFLKGVKNMGWSYAELSKLAKANGGPEKLVELLIKSGEKKALPRIGVAFVGGIAVTIGVQEIIKYLSHQKDVSSPEVESVKKEIIQGIKDYDATQADIENKTSLDSDVDTDEDTEINEEEGD